MAFDFHPMQKLRSFVRENLVTRAAMANERITLISPLYLIPCEIRPSKRTWNLSRRVAGWELLLIERDRVGKGRVEMRSIIRFVFQRLTADLWPAFLIDHLHILICDDANGIDLTLTYISISFIEFMRAGKSHDRENSACVQAYLWWPIIK